MTLRIHICPVLPPTHEICSPLKSLNSGGVCAPEFQPVGPIAYVIEIAQFLRGAEGCVCAPLIPPPYRALHIQRARRGWNRDVWAAVQHG
jgi:hypothetical protein